MKQPTVRPFDVATKKLHHNDKDLKHFSQVFSMQFMAKFGACQEERGNIENSKFMPRPFGCWGENCKLIQD